MTVYLSLLAILISAASLWLSLHQFKSTRHLRRLEKINEVLQRAFQLRKASHALRHKVDNTNDVPDCDEQLNALDNMIEGQIQRLLESKATTIQDIFEIEKSVLSLDLELELQSKQLDAKNQLDQEIAEAKTADIARKTERAFITAEVHAPDLPLAAPGRIWKEGDRIEVSAVIILRNHGRTAAIIRNIDVGLPARSTRPDYPPSRPEAQYALPPALAIAPSGSYELRTITILPRSVWQDTVDGKKTLYCGGRVTYDDVFGQPHVTAFCWERSNTDGRDQYGITTSEALNFFD
jgi:hypothetical protein